MQNKARHAAARSVLEGPGFVAQSEAMRAVCRAVERVAPRDITVLVTGPTGSGKEVIGSLIHAYSSRATGPLVRFNCAAIPEELAESELFGHEEGAFTGATRKKEGYIERANGGTLILDEVGELPLGLQSKLLRVCSAGEIQPVGGRSIRQVDIRIVACTNRDLLEQVATGAFRQDLYYRLAVVELKVPGMGARREEIPALVDHFRLKYMRKFGVERLEFEPEVIAHWSERSWPGHVRELENAVARAIAMSVGERVTLEDVTGPVRAPVREDRSTNALPFMDENLNFRSKMDAFEAFLIEEAIREQEGHQTRAASALGMARTTLIDKLKRHGLYSSEPR